MNPSDIKFPIRLLIYFLGMISICLGIVLCKRCNLGISPISSIPYVLEYVLPISFGVLTMFYHFFNTLLQIVISRKITAMLLAQFAFGAVFGQIINLFQRLLNFEATRLPFQLLLLAMSVFFTALGMVLMLGMKLVQNPPDGFVHLVSEKLGKEVGTIKIIYDICCVALSLTISFVCLGQFKGFGLATIVSALCVGRLVTILNPVFLPLFEKLPLKKETLL